MVFQLKLRCRDFFHTSLFVEKKSPRFLELVDAAEFMKEKVRYS